MMASASRLSLSNFHRPPPSTTIAELKPTFTPHTQPTNPTPESDATPSCPEPRKLKPSPQLNRWSRARAIRSGHKLDRPVSRTKAWEMDPPARSPETEVLQSPPRARDDDGELAAGKSIYMVSDGTGWTAEHSVNAALGQFDYCLVDRGCPVNTHLFSGVSWHFARGLILLIFCLRNAISKSLFIRYLRRLGLKFSPFQRLLEIIKQAAKEGAMLVYTLADNSMAESARQACRLWGVPSTDILSPITEAISSHLGVSPSGLPRGAPGRNFPLSEEYFQRIEAIEFTIKQDDGALPQNLQKADIILTGVSRTGKTPLSIYLAQKGYKVANVPLVMGVALPKMLFEVDPEKVFGLTINPVVLQTIRRSRAKSLGFGDDARSNYSEMDHVRKELEFASRIFAQNPAWPVIEVTGKAIEETAAVVLRLHQDRKNKCSMPRISKRY
ncbi:hypothetical protein RJ639_032582 [Escallonia herrerae]|uniref:Pyruvate, phosphate dikinase regulatory protein n=1 Tax=Escallonia herrerae TaxID=1293975 RepID=A0AA88X387_9ASTE|nr:hypothetical protein RJ639_032582 [Escallonia herrerae]